MPIFTPEAARGLVSCVGRGHGLPALEVRFGCVDQMAQPLGDPATPPVTEGAFRTG